MAHNNSNDRDLACDFYAAETASDRVEALNILELNRRHQRRRAQKRQVIRAAYIHPSEITG